MAITNEGDKQEKALTIPPILKEESEVELTNKYQSRLVEVIELNFGYLEKDLAKIYDSLTTKTEMKSDIEKRIFEISQLNFYADFLTSNNVFYENCFVFISTFALLKLDSFL